MRRTRVIVHAIVLALATASCAEHNEADEQEGQGEVDADRDSATLRRQAADEWYNEGHTGQIGKNGGVWSPAYRRYVIDVATAERARWGDALPSPGKQPIVGGTTWVNIGPNKADYIKNGVTLNNITDSGRVRSIVIDPTNPARIFVATAGGGVWRTTDGGASWTALTENLGSLSCGSLAMDPADPSTLYLGLGDPFDGTGVGLVKSTDGGDSWSAPIYLGVSSQIPQILVRGTAVLVATDMGLYRSVAGGPFEQVDLATGQPVAPYVWSLAATGASGVVLSLEANHAATSGTTDGQVWWSNDDGATWTRASGVTKSSGVGRITLGSSPSSATVYAMAAVPNATSSSDLADIFKSTNGGTSFAALGVTRKRYTNSNRESSTLATLLYGQGWYNATVLVHPTNPNMAFFGGALLLARTSDGGSSYTQMSNWLAQYKLPYVHADFHAAAYGPDGSLYVGSDGGIFKSTDNGVTWSSSLNVGIITHLLYSVGSTTAGGATSAVIGGFQDNGTRVRSGSTMTFDQTLGGDGIGSDINQANASLALGTLYYSRVYKSTDGGLNFSLSCSGITDCNSSTNGTFYTRLARWTGDPSGNTIFTYSNVKVYKTTNYATSWTALGTTGFPSGMVVRNVNVAHGNASYVGVAGSGGRILLTSNGGSSWTVAASPPNNDLSMSYVHFDSSDPNVVYAASVAAKATANHLWKSTDFGASWSAIDGNGLPFGIPVNVVKGDPQDHNVLYAGTHLGVYRSLDGGASWTRFGSGLPLVNVTDLYISASTSLVRAATFGRGFWELQP